MLSSKEINPRVFLNEHGLIYFILNQIFEKREMTNNILERIEFIRIMLYYAQHTQ